jgi:hypothetical protein
MLRLAPSVSSSTSSGAHTTYTLDITSNRGAPIAEAGFTITGLTPTYSNGSGVMTQQQNFVLLGGHTQSAFINMSQVAIWSLPEESWSFVTVNSPVISNGNTELAIKSAVTSVDSRSGHTAVLSEDGSKIIVLGGWVGNLNQAADPQLAVLSLGTGFGGKGNWQWEVPVHQPSGSGIYGHGAVMLPGNVMMVLGGYNVSASSNSKRATGSSTPAMFFNATSMQWISNYTNPAYVAAIQNNAASTLSSSKSKATKVGLGAGLGLGLAAIICALIVYFWYSRRLKNRRKEVREENLRNLSIGASNFYSPRTEIQKTRGGFPWSNGGWNGNDVNEPGFDSTRTVAGYEHLHPGVHSLGGPSSIPAPPRQIPRKPLHSRSARGMYQPAPTLDFNAAGGHGRGASLGTAGPIHPIYEADEEDHATYTAADVGVAIGEPSSRGPSPERNRYSDPFKDPQGGNPTAMRPQTQIPDAGSIAQSREREIQDWVSDWAAADVLLNSQIRTHSNAGRLSPTRRAQLIAASNATSISGEEESGRTASNLSERSVAISGFTISRSGSSNQGRSRSNSLRGFITGINPFASTVLSTTVGPSTNISTVFDGPAPHGARNPPTSAGSTSETSFNTARTSFHALQEQGESLLPRPGDDFSARDYSPTRSHHDSLPGSPSKNKPSTGLGKGRSQGWLGSLRRVFAGGVSGNTSPDSPTYSSRDNSPTRPFNYSAMSSDGAEPRRTVSAGATLWRRKQGKGDWEDSADNNNALRSTGRSNTFTGSLPRNIAGVEQSSGTDGEEESEDEWDIERAVENRVVQVMFTVPKEKLRVVNHDFEEEKSEVGSLRGGSIKSKKGSGRRSVKDLFGIGEDGRIEEKAEEAASKPLLEFDEKEEIRESPRAKEKGKGKVREILEKIEGRSPEHSPVRS